MGPRGAVEHKYKFGEEIVFLLAVFIMILIEEFETINSFIGLPENVHAYFCPGA